MDDNTLVHQIDVAKQFQSDSPQRVEADTQNMVEFGFVMANRAANPSLRPAEAIPLKNVPKDDARQIVFNFA